MPIIYLFDYLEKISHERNQFGRAVKFFDTCSDAKPCAARPDRSHVLISLPGGCREYAGLDVGVAPVQSAGGSVIRPIPLSCRSAALAGVGRETWHPDAMPRLPSATKHFAL